MYEYTNKHNIYLHVIHIHNICIVYNAYTKFIYKHNDEETKSPNILVWERYVTYEINNSHTF